MATDKSFDIIDDIIARGIIGVEGSHGASMSERRDMLVYALSDGKRDGVEGSLNFLGL